jgi:hypothetical protein
MIILTLIAAQPRLDDFETWPSIRDVDVHMQLFEQTMIRALKEPNNEATRPEWWART